MRFAFQIIQTYTKQPIPSILLTFKGTKYLFNVPETFQRFSKDHNIRLPKGSRIFITKLDYNRINGIFVLLLRLNHINQASDVHLYGPPGLSQYLEDMRYMYGYQLLLYSSYDFFNFNKKLLGIKSETALNQIVSKQDFKISKIHKMLREKQNKNPSDVSDAHAFVKNDFYYKDENLEIHPLFILPDFSARGDKPSICYICKSSKIQGKVNGDKIKELQIPPQYIKQIISEGELKINGVLYKASDFKEPDEPAPVVIIIDCPNKGYIESLVNQEALRAYLEENINKNDKAVKAIVHMAPVEVLSDPQYSQFFEKFEKECEHIFVNEQLKETSVNEANSANQYNIPVYKHFARTNLLAKYFPKHFPLISHIPARQDHQLDKVMSQTQNKSVGKSLVEFVMQPLKHQGFTELEAPQQNVEFVSSLEHSPKFQSYYKRIVEEIRRASQKTAITDQYILPMFEKSDPELVFLGTTSMAPTSFRNNSAIYLRFWQQEDIGFLLDCGEGTYFQLLHHYGAQKTRELLKNLSVIYITHIHADHHLGLMDILLEREKILKEENITKEPVFLVIPSNLISWIKNYENIQKLNSRLIFSNDLRIKTADNQASDLSEDLDDAKVFKNRKKNQDMGITEMEYYESPDEMKYVKTEQSQSIQNIELFNKFLLEKLGIKAFKTELVYHCPHAFAVMIEHTNGWKFAYSGDTKPCKRMVESFGNLTVLVHEATFTAEQASYARMRRHSTENEAVEMGMKMNAWRTVLTHFSSRLDNLALRKSKDGEKKNKEKQGISQKEWDEYYKNNTLKASDHLKCKFSELSYMPLVTQFVEDTFSKIPDDLS